MPTKRQLADAAAERQEDQRALVIVLAAAVEHEEQYAGNDQRLVDAIARVKAAFLRIDTPPKSSELPGQLAIDGTVAGEPVAPPRELGAPMAEAFDVPKQCPSCGNNMLLVWGGSWTPMRLESRSGATFQHGLQCGYCAHVEYVHERAYEAVVAERQRTIGASDAAAVKPARETRTRGAR